MATLSEAMAIALQHHQAGRLQAAEQIYRQILAVEPHQPDALHHLGRMAQQLGKPEIAVEYMTRAIASNGTNATYHNSLGMAFQIQGKLDDAVACYRRAVELRQDFAEAHNNLGTSLKDQGKLNAAVACYRRALELMPHCAEMHGNLGNALKDLGNVEEAVACQRRALELKPDFAESHNNLGNALKDQGQWDAAAACYRRALELKPGHAEAHNNLGNVCKDQGHVADALACYRKSLALNPNNARIHSNLVLTLNYASDYEARAIYEEHRRWSLRHTEPLAKNVHPHVNERSGTRRLRLGYVSPNLCEHSVAFFLEPILAHHAAEQVEVFCYAEVGAPDAVTARIQSLVPHWRSTCGLSDEQLASLIRADGTDVLIDLAGHTGGNRLLVFARKPAPVQVTYLGYPNTTGLQSIDYRLTDAIADPPGTADECHSEQLIRLPGTFLCYRPPADCPLPAEPPALTRGGLTFGSFNTLTKIGPGVAALWTRVLTAVPGSRLLLKTQGLADEGVRKQVQARFVAQGLDPARLVLRGWEPSQVGHLQWYNEVDVALDTHPYNGTTTICEALWMGVPVVTLAGDCHAARVGASLLNAVGLNDLIASTPDEYVVRARLLSEDREELARLRRGLRDRMSRSPLCDGKTFTRGLEETLRDLWRRWCARP